MKTDYQRTRARVVRAGDTTAHLAITDWYHGQITVPAPTLILMAVTGLERQDLPGTDFIITANLAASTDMDVHPHDFQAAHIADLRVLPGAA